MGYTLLPGSTGGIPIGQIVTPTYAPLVGVNLTRCLWINGALGAGTFASVTDARGEALYTPDASDFPTPGNYKIIVSGAPGQGEDYWLDITVDQSGSSGEGGVVVNVLPGFVGPVAMGSIASGNLEAVQGSLYAVTFAVVDQHGNAIDLSGMSLLEMVFVDPNNPKSVVFRATIGGAHASISVGGTSFNMVTLAVDPTLTAAVINLEWVLADGADNEVFTQGLFEVTPFTSPW